MNEFATFIFLVSAGLVALQLLSVVAWVSLLHSEAHREQLYPFENQNNDAFL